MALQLVFFHLKISNESMKRYTRFFIALPICLFVAFQCFAQSQMSKRMEVLHLLRQPFGEVHVGTKSSAISAKKHLYIGFDQKHFEFKGVDTAVMFDLISDILWDYVLGDSSNYYDSTYVSLETVSGVNPVFKKAGNQVVKSDEYERSTIVRAVLAVDNMLNIFPSDEPGVNEIEIFLYINTALFNPNTSDYYAKLLPYLIFEYMIKRDTKRFHSIMIKVMGENNFLLDRYIYDTKEIARTLSTSKK
jgi:hypothetical protein